MKSLSTQRPVCSCGQPFTIVDGLCADCWTAKTGDTPRHQCCGRPMQPWPHDRCMCVQPAKHIRCEGCGIPIPEPGENPDPAALLCDRCYDSTDGGLWADPFVGGENDV